MDLSVLPDEELLHQFQQHGAPIFFSELVRRHEPEVLRRCYQHLKDRDNAKDVSQEVFLRLLTKSASYQPGLPFKPWLGRIVHNRCMDHLKQDKKDLHQEISSRIADTLEEEIDTEGVMRPTVEILQELLEKVSGEEKLILLLKYEQRWPVLAIQKSLNLNENTVKSRLKRSREKLKALLTQYSEAS